MPPPAERVVDPALQGAAGSRATSG
jgi:hypothetical protein